MVGDDRPFLPANGPVLSADKMYERISMPSKYNYQAMTSHCDRLAMDRPDICRQEGANTGEQITVVRTLYRNRAMNVLPADSTVCGTLEMLWFVRLRL